VEPDPEATRVAQAHGTTILGAHLSDLRGHYADRFDVITLSHVIEHVHDPDALLRDCRDMLKTGGFFWIETPNINSVGYEVYKSAWRGLEPPRHLILFNYEALTSSLKKAGFKDVTVLPPRDVVDVVFSQSASVAAGYTIDTDPSTLTRAAQRELHTNMRRARRLMRSEPKRSEFITAVGFKR
jgi:predicted SAM-dependent methyltransferase